MKFGVCVNMLKKSPVETGIELVGKVAAMGYDYVEMPLGETMLLTDAELTATKEKFKSLGIPCYSCNNFFPRDYRLVGPNVDYEKIRDYYCRALKRASELGVTFIGFGSPWAKEIPDGFSKEAAWEQMIKICKEIGQEAERYDITIVLEHNNKTETNLLNQFHEVGKLAEEVNHPNICVLVDYFHICMESEPIENLRKYKNYLKHAHFARHEKRGYPRSMDEDPNYQVFIDTLREIGYTGGMSVEAFTDDFDDDGPATLKFLRENFN